MRKAISGVSALAALQPAQARTRLSGRSYAVWPRRGRTWSSVMASGGVVTPQYAQTDPCCARSQSRWDCTERPEERRRGEMDPAAERCRALGLTNHTVEGLNRGPNCEPFSTRP